MTKQQIEALKKIKGPWELKPCSHGGLILIRGDDKPGSHIQSHMQIVPEEEAIAIAALPELLQEREEMIRLLESVWAGVPDKTRSAVSGDDDSLRSSSYTVIAIFPEMLRKLKAALARAEGEEKP